MKSKVFCSVCRVSFITGEALADGTAIICTVCGAKLEILEISPEIRAQRFPQEPETEIRERVDNFARLRGFVFNENKDAVLEGMLEKHKRYGDFYCPCRFDNIPENICPCLETRMGHVRKDGSCL